MGKFINFAKIGGRFINVVNISGEYTMCIIDLGGMDTPGWMEGHWH